MDRAGRSRIARVFAPNSQKAELRRLGLPLVLTIRFLSLRLSTGELEVLATSLLDEKSYPTQEFQQVYGWRWNHETFYFMMKSRLDLENFSGQTAEATFDVAIPDRDLDRQGGRLAAKFHSLADPVVGAERADMLQRQIARLDEDHDIHVLMAA